MNEPDANSALRVVVEPHGWTFDAPAGVALLTSARRAGIVLPSSCRNGTCRTCRCRLLRGSVRHAVEWPGLSAEEKLEGWILPCVALPQTPLAIDMPRAVDSRSAG